MIEDCSCYAKISMVPEVVGGTGGLDVISIGKLVAGLFRIEVRPKRTIPGGISSESCELPFQGRFPSFQDPV